MTRPNTRQKPSATHWWTTLPGILTGLGGLGGAAALITALAASGIIKSPGSTAPSSQSASAGTFDKNPSLIQGQGNVIQNATIVQGSNNSIALHASEGQNGSDLAKLLHGTWKGTTTQAAPNGEMISVGYTSVLGTGAYNFSGEVLFRGKGNDGPVEVLFTALAAGTWQLVGDKYVVTLFDLKTSPKVLKLQGKPNFDLSNPLTIPEYLRPRLENMIPKGSSLEYKIVELTKSSLRLQGTDLRGNTIHYDGAREVQ